MDSKETAYWKRRHPQGIQGDVKPKKAKPVAKKRRKPMTPERAQINEDKRINEALPVGRKVIKLERIEDEA